MDTLYAIFLALHSIVRWLVVIAAVIAVGRAVAGWIGKRPWKVFDDKISTWFTIFMDSQVLIGLILYFFLSPMMRTALQNFGGVMGNASVRYFAVEHVFLMLIALALVHVGRSRSRKAATDLAKHRNAAIWFGLAVVVLLAAIPWPFLDVGRPWIRFF